jgi:outer membrane protein OmpA-like peptidoglycan-associated protein
MTPKRARVLAISLPLVCVVAAVAYDQCFYDTEQVIQGQASDDSLEIEERGPERVPPIPEPERVPNRDDEKASGADAVPPTPAPARPRSEDGTGLHAPEPRARRVATIPFSERRSTLEREVLEELRTRVVPVLDADSGMSFVVSGHTQQGVDQDADRALARRRAEVVRDELVRLGVSRSRLYLEAMGSVRPFVGPDGVADPDYNDRVEISEAPQ